MSGSVTGLAPIVFFGYNRAVHARWALESIKACPESSGTPITIYMDGPRGEDGVAAVEAARAAVREAAPAHARIVYRDTNLGLANSVRAGVSEACEEHGKVIVIEDDLVLAPSALTWFNRALAAYEDDERVMHIAGFWPEPRRSLPESFFLRWPGVWGWATWKRAWDHLNWDLAELRDAVLDRGLVEHLNEGGWDFFGQLEGTLEGRYDSWAIRWYASVMLNDGLALHPRESLVRNTGTDGSGAHGDESTAFEVRRPSGSGPPSSHDSSTSRCAIGPWILFVRVLWPGFAPLWTGLRRAFNASSVTTGTASGFGGSTVRLPGSSRSEGTSPRWSVQGVRSSSILSSRSTSTCSSKRAHSSTIG